MSKDLETVRVLDIYLLVDIRNRRVCEVSNPIYDRMFRGSRFTNEIVTLLVEYRNRITDLEAKLAEHNEYFRSFSCENFNEFQDFISTFMLTPHEEQTVIRELKQQLHELPKKIVEEIRKQIIEDIDVTPDYHDEYNLRLSTRNKCIECLDKILKKHGGKNE